MMSTAPVLTSDRIAGPGFEEALQGGGGVVGHIARREQQSQRAGLGFVPQGGKVLTVVLEQPFHA